MRPTPPLTDVVGALPASVPFVGPEALERAMGRPFAARIGANESVFGPSPAALAAIRDAAPGAWMYGDPECRDLRAAIADLHGVGIANVVCGVGIDGLLGTVVRLFVGPGTPVVTSHGGYPTFMFHVRAAGGALHEVPYADDREDLAGLAARARAEGARVVYVANPDNPMGTWHDAAAIRALRDALPDDTLLCLDEAYADTAPAAAIGPVDTSDGGVVRLRTFSKAHGLAGLRVGYALGAEATIAAFDRVREHFGVGRLAQTAALASLGDPGHLAATVGRIAEARARIEAIAAGCGLATVPSAANFVAADCGRDGDHARAVLAACAERGVFLRMPGVAPLDRCVRVTVGLPEHLDLLERVLPEALAAAG